MNIENARKLLSQLRRLDSRKFFMPWWEVHTEKDLENLSPDLHAVALERLEECGTIACGAGWCKLLNSTDPEVDPQKFSRDFLEIDYPTGLHLFCGGFTEKPITEITLDDFIHELERMIKETL